MSMTHFRAFFAGLPILLAACLLFSCGKNDNSPSGPKTINDGVADTVRIIQVIPDKASDSPYPRIAFDCGDWAGVELEYPGFGQQKTEVFQLANTRTRKIWLVAATGNGFTITEFNGTSENLGWGQAVFSASVDGDVLRCAQLYHYDSNGGEASFNTDAVSEIPLSAIGSKAGGIMTRGQTEDAIRKSFYELFEEIGSGWDKLGNYLGGTANEICSMLKDVVVPLAQLNLYADDVNALQRLMKEKQKEVKVEDVIVELIGSDSVSWAWEMYQKMQQCVHVWADSWGSVNDYLDRMNRTLAIAPKMKMATETAATAKAEYKINLVVTDKTSDAVSLKAEITPLVSDPAPVLYVEFKALLDCKSEVSGYYDFEAPYEWTVDNIGGGGCYLFSAMASTENGLHYPASVVVQMPHYFEVDPAFLKMGIEGGTAYFSVTVPDESSWTWKVAEKPSWVTIAGIGKRTLSINVAATSGERNGDMWIETTDGADVKRHLVPIFQSGSGWDGTAWSVSPKLNINMSGRDADKVQYGQGLNYIEFMVTDAASGGFQSNIPWNSMRVSGKSLVFTYRNTQTFQYGEKGGNVTLTENVTMNVTRTDDTHAKVTVRGTGKYTGAAEATCSASGSGVATRMN